MGFQGSPVVVTVDGLTFNGLDDNICEWTIEDISGWHDGPGVDVDQIQRLVTHGQFAQQGRRTGRTITIEGQLWCDTRGPVTTALRKLTAVLADGRFDDLTVTDDDDLTLRARVQLLARPQTKWVEATQVDFQLQFLAPSPYRFGSTSTSSTGFGSDPVAAGLVFDLFSAGGSLDFGAQGSSGSVSISNPGTAAASVRFTVVGPTPVGGFVITPQSSGRPIRFLGSVPSGSSLVFDGASGTVVINGTADRLGDTIISGWPTIPAGGSDSFVFTSLGSNTAAVMTASAVATYY